MQRFPKCGLKSTNTKKRLTTWKRIEAFCCSLHLKSLLVSVTSGFRKEKNAPSISGSRITTEITLRTRLFSEMTSMKCMRAFGWSKLKSQLQPGTRIVSSLHLVRRAKSEETWIERTQLTSGWQGGLSSFCSWTWLTLMKTSITTNYFSRIQTLWIRNSLSLKRRTYFTSIGSRKLSHTSKQPKTQLRKPTNV